MEEVCMEEVSMGRTKNYLEKVEEFVEDHSTAICVTAFVLTYGIITISNVLLHKKIAKQDKEYSDKLLLVRSVQG